MKIAGIKMNSEFDAVKLLQELSLLREDLRIVAETVSDDIEKARKVKEELENLEKLLKEKISHVQVLAGHVAKEMEKLREEMQEVRRVWDEFEKQKIRQKAFWKEEKKSISELISVLEKGTAKIFAKIEKRVRKIEEEAEKTYKKAIYPAFLGLFGIILTLGLILGGIIGYKFRESKEVLKTVKTEKAQILCTKKQCYLVVPLSKFEKNFEKEKKYLKK